MNADRESGGVGRFESSSYAENGHAMSEDSIHVTPIEGTLFELILNEGDAHDLTEDEDAEEGEDDDDNEYDIEDEDGSMNSENETLELEIKETV